MPQGVPIDGGVVVAYLAAYLLKGGRRIADTALESMVDRLVERVAAPQGARPRNTHEQDPPDRPPRAAARGPPRDRSDVHAIREVVQQHG